MVLNINKIPGAVEDARVFNVTEFALFVTYLMSSITMMEDGYVEIVACNCGCDGECVVYTEERQFECRLYSV